MCVCVIWKMSCCVCISLSLGEARFQAEENNREKILFILDPTKPPRKKKKIVVEQPLWVKLVEFGAGRLCW